MNGDLPRPGIYNAVLRSDRFSTASVYKMRLRADPHRSQIRPRFFRASPVPSVVRGRC